MMLVAAVALCVAAACWLPDRPALRPILRRRLHRASAISSADGFARAPAGAGAADRPMALAGLGLPGRPVRGRQTNGRAGRTQCRGHPQAHRRTRPGWRRTASPVRGVSQVQPASRRRAMDGTLPEGLPPPPRGQARAPQRHAAPGRVRQRLTSWVVRTTPTPKANPTPRPNATSPRTPPCACWKWRPRRHRRGADPAGPTRKADPRPRTFPSTASECCSLWKKIGPPGRTPPVRNDRRLRPHPAN